MTIGSLFSGIGGLELGLESCGLGPVLWQAESDPYARAVLAKHWPWVKRYEDVREIDQNAEKPDIICGGFPCQDISNAGKRAGIDGDRSGLWSEFARIVGVVRPNRVFVENVSALLVRGLDRVLGDLAALGYNAEWDCFRATDVGAPHRRERIFVLAYPAGLQFRGVSRAGVDGVGYSGPWPVSGKSSVLANANGERQERSGVAWGRRDGLTDGGDGTSGAGDVADTGGAQFKGAIGEIRRIGSCVGGGFPPGPSEITGWNGPQPAVRRGVDGIPRRVDRLRCLGNAVVPAQAALAFRVLSERVHD